MLSDWLDCLFIFICRHVLIGLENLAFTIAVGLLLLKCLTVCDVGHLLSLSWRIRLRRLIFIAALAKGALYTLGGSSFRAYAPERIVYGFQIPDPTAALALPHVPESSPLHPTHATALVATVLLGYAAFRFAVRLWGVRSSASYARALRIPLDPASQEALRQLVRNCANSLSLPRLAWTQIYVIAMQPQGGRDLGDYLELPVIVGFWQPRIVIDTWWSSLIVTHPDKLRSVIAHELMHIARGHHRFRWLMLWLRDIAVLTGFGSAAANEIIACDEFQADVDSARTAAGVRSLAEVIRSAVARNGDIDIAGQDSRDSGGVVAAGHDPAPNEDLPQHRFTITNPQQLSKTARKRAAGTAQEVSARLTGFRRTSHSIRSLQERRLHLLLDHAQDLMAKSRAGRRLEGRRERGGHAIGIPAAKLVSIVAIVFFTLVLALVFALRIYLHPA